MAKHTSIEEAVRLLHLAYSCVGKHAPSQEWCIAVEKFLTEHADYTLVNIFPRPHYIVFRPNEELEGKVSANYDGYWYDYNSVPICLDPETSYDWAIAKRHPNNYYELREDGALAEVWIVELNPKYKRTNG